jgi:hypothetical protein
MQEERLEPLGELNNPILKRRFPRYPIDVAVKVLVQGFEGVSTCCYGRGTEISEGGMAIYIAHEFSIGDPITVKVTLPHASQPVECPAIVRNRRNYCYGIEFMGLNPADQKFLNLMCRGLALVQ